jgi:hypothetical protein
VAHDYKHDVAFSLLDQDESLARELSKLLEPADTFLYSERQREIVSTDGVEKFSSVFRRDARTVAVLHRAGWGTTPWTRVEETAIRERFHHEGADFITIIKLDDSTPPIWIPTTRVWGDFSRLKAEGVAGVLLERLRHAGSQVRTETAQELAARVAREQIAERERVKFLGSSEGVKAATKSAHVMIAKLREVGGTIGAAVTGEQEIINLYREEFSVSASWQNPYINTLNDSALHVKEWAGRPDIGGRFIHHTEPEELRHWRFAFDRPTADDLGWREPESRRMFSPDQLADFAAKLLLTRVREAIGKSR